MTDSDKIEALVALIRRRPGLRKAQLCDALDIDDEPLTQLLAIAQLEGQIYSKATEARNGLMLPEYHAAGLPGWQPAGSSAVEQAPAAVATQVSAPQPAADLQNSESLKKSSARTLSRAATAVAFLKEHGPSTSSQLREAMAIKKGHALNSYLAPSIAAGRILVQDGLYSLAASGSELIKASSSPARDDVASLDSTPLAASCSGAGGASVVAQRAEQTTPLTWSIFPDGQVGIFTSEYGTLRQQLFLSQADVAGLHAFLSQTKTVWNIAQAQEQA